MEKRVFLSPPHMGGKELEYIKDVFASNYIAPLGQFVDLFEKKISEFTASKGALAVSSGTSAIHLALKILNIGEGDTVLASTFTFIGSVSPVTFEKGVPIFIDSSLDSWNLDPELLDSSIKSLIKRGSHPKALILTHLYGQPAQVDIIRDICRNYDIFLIEDAAESLGATLNGKHTGTFGDIGIYSFNGNKIITTSGGGAMVSDNLDYILKGKFYSTQAKEDNLWYEHKEIGFNYRMSNVVAAIGVGQIEVLKSRIARKREIFDLYTKFLSEIDEIDFMPEIKGAFGNRWLTCITLKKGDPINLIKKLDQHNIESRPLWKPMHLQPVFKGVTSFTNGVSEGLFKKGICLPSGTAMTDDTIKIVANIIKEHLYSESR